MTMIPTLVNAGNRTKDELHVFDLETYHAGGKPKHTIRRGQKVDLGAFIGHPIVLTCNDGPDDRFVGKPQIIVVDEPQAD